MPVVHFPGNRLPMRITCILMGGKGTIRRTGYYTQCPNYISPSTSRSNTIIVDDPRWCINSFVYIVLGSLAVPGML